MKTPYDDSGLSTEEEVYKVSKEFKINGPSLWCSAIVTSFGDFQSADDLKTALNVAVNEGRKLGYAAGYAAGNADGFAGRVLAPKDR